LLTGSPGALNPLILMTFTYSQAQLSSFPWIVSAATLRLTDCAVAFSDALANIASMRGETLDTYLSIEDQRLLNVAAAISSRYGCETMSNVTAEKLQWILCQTLCDALNTIAPLGTYFGSSEGDGACFGFWLSDDAAELDETLSLPDDSAAIVGVLQAIDSIGLYAESFADAPLFSVTGETHTNESAECGDYAECGWLEPDGVKLLSEQTSECLWSFADLIQAFKWYDTYPSCYPGEPRWLTISSGSDDGLPSWQSPWRFAAATPCAIGASVSVHRPDNMPHKLWQAVCAAIGYRY